ncbi:MAG: ATP-binding protein [Ignavibacteriaceae bacterium]
MTKIDSIIINNQLQDILKVMAVIERCAAEAPLSVDVENALSLSVDELLTNIISYGYADSETHQISVDLYLENDEKTGKKAIALKITDDGIEFNPLNSKEVDLDIPLEEKKIGGLGIHLVKRLMDELIYERLDDKNILTLKKVLNNIKEN